MQDEKNGGKDEALINLEWRAFEFEKYEKGPIWFIIVGALALILFTVALLLKSFIFAVMIILAVFAVFIYALKEPRLINFKIDGKGILIDHKLYEYQDLKSFWIFYDPPETKELSIQSKKWLAPLIKIPLAEEDPTIIRNALIKFIPEEKQELSLIDVIAKNFRF